MDGGTEIMALIKRRLPLTMNTIDAVTQPHTQALRRRGLGMRLVFNTMLNIYERSKVTTVYF